MQVGVVILEVWYGTPEFNKDYKYITKMLPNIVEAWTMCKKDQKVMLMNNENKFVKAANYFQLMQQGGFENPVKYIFLPLLEVENDDILSVYSYLHLLIKLWYANLLCSSLLCILLLSEHCL